MAHHRKSLHQSSLAFRALACLRMLLAEALALALALPLLCVEDLRTLVLLLDALLPAAADAPLFVVFARF